ncbi:MAG: histidine phosphatase family protein [Clostridia bacterium]|nr:histidine phosphatase family protein [Clostridia bacterium]MBQ3077653.1 histidine phosphatase family protein [Clostridia bacterium]
MTTVYLVRHCESMGNIGNRMQGRTDCDISENGARQLENLTRRMADEAIDVIYSSPLTRARKTAEAIRGVREMEIQIVEDLQEMSFGDWEDRTWAELREAYPEESHKWNDAPYEMVFQNGETFEMVEQRTAAAIEAIVKAHPGKTIAIATHATPIRVYARRVLEADYDLSTVEWARNTSISTFSFDDEGKVSLVQYGDFSHQPEELLYHFKRKDEKRYSESAKQ